MYYTATETCILRAIDQNLQINGRAAETTLVLLETSYDIQGFLTSYLRSLYHRQKNWILRTSTPNIQRAGGAIEAITVPLDGSWKTLAWSLFNLPNDL
jgi:hypothetical protein